MVEIVMPEVPVLGIPTGTKETGQRVDMRPTQFDMAIETKGYLLAWTRASVCPCGAVSEKTTVHDPNCTRCEGKGWFYFGGNVPQDLTGTEWDLNGIQSWIISSNGAMVIRGIVSGIQANYNPWDKLGNWQSGTMQVTVRHGNKLGHYDKLIILDSEIAYSEVLIADGSGTLQGRYPMTGVNSVQGETQAYGVGDFSVDDQGRIAWFSGKEPASGTRLAIHYLCHPTFLVIEHPHVIRTTSRKFKSKVTKTPTGDPRSLPIQAIVRYDFLP